MFENRYPFEDRHTGRQGELRVAGGVWHRDVCTFEFSDSVFGLAGTIACDWREAGPQIEVVEGDASQPGCDGVLQLLRERLRAFHRGAYVGVTDRELARLYAGDYHQRMNLASDNELERAFKRHMVDQILRMGAPGRVLAAGCSAGETLRQLHARGVDAHGFDLCPDLLEIAYPEVREHVRVGSVTEVPYGPEDGFDTVLALDLFEHVPEDRVPQMVRELERLQPRRVVAHIALCEFQYPGHLTLRPLSWWDEQLAPSFRRVADATSGEVAGGFGVDPSRYLRVYESVGAPIAS
jgi:hypothetical protein